MSFFAPLDRLPMAVIVLGIGIVLLWLIALQILWIRQQARLRKLFRGRSVSMMEDIITQHGEELVTLSQRGDGADRRIASNGERLQHSISRVHLVRFNPFGAGGADQSFSLALLDENGDGVVISSLQSGEGGTRVYGKAISKGGSEYRLSPEEERAITEAMNSHHEVFRQ
jgi:hypothetical protein